MDNTEEEKRKAYLTKRFCSGESTKEEFFEYYKIWESNLDDELLNELYQSFDEVERYRRSPDYK
jgi:hypothetical protein